MGDLMFLFAAFLFAGFLTLNAKWKAGPAQILLALSLVGAAGYLPVWWWFLPKHLLTAARGDLAVQALYQGVLAPIVGMVLISQATSRCGSVMVGAILSSVPVISAILARLWLYEDISKMSWIGIAITTTGVLITIAASAKRSKINFAAGRV